MSKNPVRLDKVEEKADDVILTLYHSIMMLTGVSATESGVQYNAFDKIV